MNGVVGICYIGQESVDKVGQTDINTWSKEREEKKERMAVHRESVNGLLDTGV